MLRYLLLLIFTGYMGVISLYTHVHVVNGVTVVHSHPFHRETGGKPFHTHSQLEFQLIKLLTSYNLTTDVIPHFKFVPACFLLTSREGDVVMAFCSLTDTGNLFGRAPPFYVFSWVS